MPAPYRPDNWSWLNRWLGDGFEEFPRHPVGWQLAASWVPQEDRRRLAAYTICGAFLDGTMHYWQPYLDVKQRRKWREYGDAQLFATQARSSVMGEDQTIDVQVDVDGDGAADPAGETAREWLLEWADRESLTTRLLDAEYDAMGLGDAVYALGLSGADGRPRLRVYDPGWYFPDPTSQGPDDDFPSTVHVAWEEPKPGGNAGDCVLRRRTWKLVTLEGGETRTYPWTDPESGPSTQTVLYWDGIWDLSAVAGANGLYDLSDEKATWQVGAEGLEARALDIGLDFIPVIHIPNGSPGKALWGRPVWWAVVRLLDDIAASDTDAQVGSEIYGSGALLDKGGGIGNTGAAGPGAHFSVPETADAKFIDMSAGVKAMLEFRADQRDLAGTNSRLPAEILGRVKASEVASGVLLRLTFGPFSSLIRELRQVRKDKYSLLLKMAMRLGQRAELLAPGVLPRAELQFGSYLPSDQAEAVLNVTSLWDRPNPLISLETAIAMLINAGFPIEDAHEELLRINREAYGRAIQLLEATGSEVAVRALLNTGDQGEIPDAPVVTVLPVPNPANPAPPGSGHVPPNAPPPPAGGGP